MLLRGTWNETQKRFIGFSDIDVTGVLREKSEFTELKSEWEVRKPRCPVMCRAERIISSTPSEAHVLALGKRSDTTTHITIWERERFCAAAGRFADFVAWQQGSSFLLVLVFKKKGISSSAESKDRDVWKWERSPSIEEMRKAWASYGKRESQLPRGSPRCRGDSLSWIRPLCPFSLPPI